METPRALSKLLERIGNPLEWSTTDKSLAALLVVSSIAVGYALWGGYLVAHPDLAPYLDLDFLALAVRVQLGELVLWFTLIAIGLGIRKRHPESRLFVHTLAQCYALFNALGLYAIGQFSSTAGVTLLGNAFVGLLLFDLRVVIPAALPTSLVLGATTYASWSGALPYAPLLKESPFEPGGTIAGWWLVNFGGTSILIAVGSLGVFAYILHLWRDRETKLAAAYGDLSEAKDQLVRAESLAALGSLVAGAAHELRNPLSASGATLQSLKEELPEFSGLSEAQRGEMERALDLALAGEHRAAQIIERLYQLSDSLAHVGAMRPVRAILEALRTRYPSVTFDVGAGLPGPGAETAPLPDAGEPAGSLLVNERAVTTILSNLLDNAIAAGGEGPVRLSVGLTGAGAAVPSPPRPPSPNRLGEGEAEPGEAGERDSLLFTISDTGCGIPADQQPDVFKPFFTGERAGEGHGVGLGLYVVYELVTRMGGTVELESEVGRGTRARVRVPVEG